MIFYGVLGKLTRKWCGDDDGTLQNDLIGGEGGMICAEPAQRVQEMAAGRAARPELRRAPDDAPCRRDPRGDRPRGPRSAALYQRVSRQVRRPLPGGAEARKPDALTTTRCRCCGRSASWRGRTGRPCARRVDGGEGVDESLRRQAEARVAKALAEQPLPPADLRLGAPATPGDRVRDRENLRFERTRLFGRCRRMFVELGRRLHADGRARRTRATSSTWRWRKLLGFVEGTATTTRPAGLAGAAQGGVRPLPRAARARPTASRRAAPSTSANDLPAQDVTR